MTDLFQVVIISEENQQVVTQIVNKRSITIGRLDSNDIVLQGKGVSRLHGKVLFLDEQTISLHDQSSNGIFIDQKRLTKDTMIAPGQQFKIDTFLICFMPVSEDQKTNIPNLHQTDICSSEPVETRSVEPGEEVDQLVELKRVLHSTLLEYLDLQTLDFRKLSNPDFRQEMGLKLTEIIQQKQQIIPPHIDQEELHKEILDEALGLGPLEDLLHDDSVSEIMVVDHHHIYIERKGRIEKVAKKFTSPEAVLAVIERIVTPLGKRIDESSPLVDARLKDGSRVNAVIPPLVLKGPCITIRKFSSKPLQINDLIDFGALTPRMAKFLERAVKAKKNILISGGTGSGKTTLLNVLSSFIPQQERIVTIEDSAELQLLQEHVVCMETKPPNLEGRAEFTIRDLVKNALRMRPDRIVVGECRGGEAFDMIQAMNTGHDGSLTTLHANSPLEAINRLETMVLMSGMDIPVKAIREQIAASVHIIVQQNRFSDGSRKITNISEVVGLDDFGVITMEDIFLFKRTGTSPEGKVIGQFMTTGYLPSFINDFVVMGLVNQGDYL